MLMPSSTVTGSQFKEDDSPPLSKGDMNLLQVLVLDALRWLEEHRERLLKLSDQLEAHELKVSLEKCLFCHNFALVIFQDGISTDPDKISVLLNWPRPCHYKDLKAFLGFTRYYRQFVCGYPVIMKPQDNLNRGYQSSTMSPRRTWKTGTYPKGDWGACIVIQ